MNFKPEEPSTEYEGIPNAEPGVYTMEIVKARTNVSTKNGERDIVDFVGDNELGVTVGASLWIFGPGLKRDGKPTKGNLFLYRRLAEAIGPDALSQYRSIDAFGYSMFNANSWRGRFVTVEVGPYGVDDVREADAAVVAEIKKRRPLLDAKTTPAATPAAKPAANAGRKHEAIDPDDIPF